MNNPYKIFIFLVLLIFSLMLIDDVTEFDFGLDERFVQDLDDFEEDEESDGDEELDKIKIVDGFKAVEVEDEVVSSAGIKFHELKSISYKKEFTAFAEVFDSTPLVTLSTAYKNLLADKKILQNDLSNINKILKRAEALHKTKSLSTRELEKYRAEHEHKSAELSALSVRIDNFIFELKSFWGERISLLVTDEDNKELFNNLAMRKTSLILLSLLKQQPSINESQDVFVNSKNERDQAIRVDYLDRSNRISNPLYGESYFYLMESNELRIGMRVFAWVEQPDNFISGLFIPESAVVWYGNQPWIYVKGEGDLFIRKPLSDAEKIPDGWIEKNNQFRDVNVVVQGGQTLLSEEFKWAIPDEDDD